MGKEKREERMQRTGKAAGKKPKHHRESKKTMARVIHSDGLRVFGE